MRILAQLGYSAYTNLGGLALITTKAFPYDRNMNSGRKPLFVLEQDCQVITSRLIQEIEKAGMQTMRSFDLDVLRSSSNEFCCPIHGTSSCTCQFVILLILRRDFGSLTVILEGVDQRTSVYLDSGLGDIKDEVDPSLTLALVNAFFPKKIIQ